MSLGPQGFARLLDDLRAGGMHGPPGRRGGAQPDAQGWRGLLEGSEQTTRVLAADLLWKLIRILSKRLRSTTDKMTFLSVTGKF